MTVLVENICDCNTSTHIVWSTALSEKNYNAIGIENLSFGK